MIPLGGFLYYTQSDFRIIVVIIVDSAEIICVEENWLDKPSFFAYNSYEIRMQRTVKENENRIVFALGDRECPKNHKEEKE